MLKRINFAAVPVKDQNRALEFYTQKVGLRVFTDQTMGDMRWIELKIPGAETMLVLHHKPKHAPTDEPAYASCTLRSAGLAKTPRRAAVDWLRRLRSVLTGGRMALIDFQGKSGKICALEHVL